MVSSTTLIPSSDADGAIKRYDAPGASSVTITFPDAAPAAAAASASQERAHQSVPATRAGTPPMLDVEVQAPTSWQHNLSPEELKVVVAQ